jgi:hypothetical protein
MGPLVFAVSPLAAATHPLAAAMARANFFSTVKLVITHFLETR